MIKKSFLILLSVIFILSSMCFSAFASPIAPDTTTTETVTDTQTSSEETSSEEVLDETTAVSDEETTVDEVQSTVETTDLNSNENGNNSKTDMRKIVLYASIVAAIICVVLIVILIIMLISIKKKKNDTVKKSRIVQGVDAGNAQTDANGQSRSTENRGGTESFDVSASQAAHTRVNNSIPVLIPEGVPAPIIATQFLEQKTAHVENAVSVSDVTVGDGFSEENSVSTNDTVETAVPTASETSFEEIQAQLMRLYDGSMKPTDFTEKVNALIIKNIYELSISSSIAPLFDITDNISSARFVVVADKYLYINFHSYCKSDFRLYSDLEGVDHCFEINTSGNRIPYGNAIKSIVPAKVELVNNVYTLVQKGKIVVEL